MNHVSHCLCNMFTIACKRGGRRKRTGRGDQDENPDEERIASQQQVPQASSGTNDAAKGLIAPAVMLGIMGAAKVGSSLYERYKNKKSDTSRSLSEVNKATPVTAATKPSKVPVPINKPSSLNAPSVKTKTSIPAPRTRPTVKAPSLLSRLKTSSSMPSRTTRGIRPLRGRGAINANIKHRQRQNVVTSLWSGQQRKQPTIREILSSSPFQNPASGDTLRRQARKANVIALSRVIHSLSKTA